MLKFFILSIFIILENIPLLAQIKPVEFTAHQDIGQVEKSGYFKYDAGEQAYYIAGGGENMWGTQDAFHYAWKQMSGDFIMDTQIKILGEGGNPHRKAGWMIRQGLDANAAYADAIVHGDGLTSLQFRKIKGGETEEKTNPEMNAPDHIRLEKEGSRITMFAAKKGEALQKVGEITMQFQEPFYVGLAVCAHEKGGFEQARFTNTRISVPVEARGHYNTLKSRLETINIYTGQRKIIYQANQHLEAPNWSRDGSFLIFNSDGLLYKIATEVGAQPELLNTGFANQCNNDHGISFNGNTLAISHRSQETNNSIIYTLPIEGGTPKRITEKGPSYWHGWSPDDKTLTYCAERNGEYDVYTISSTGGQEIRLTTAKGLDDGPEYSYDGQFIYFNSVRTGTMQIWRMKPDGTGQEQITFDEYNDWFAHPSPENRWILYITYEDEVDPGSHPANKRVMLRKMPFDGGKPDVLAYLYGGQGSINVPSWSPDGQHVAFVSYTFVQD